MWSLPGRICIPVHLITIMTTIRRPAGKNKRKEKDEDKTRQRKISQLRNFALPGKNKGSGTRTTHTEACKKQHQNKGSQGAASFVSVNLYWHGERQISLSNILEDGVVIVRSTETLPECTEGSLALLQLLVRHNEVQLPRLTWAAEDKSAFPNWASTLTQWKLASKMLRPSTNLVGYKNGWPKDLPNFTRDTSSGARMPSAAKARKAFSAWAAKCCVLEPTHGKGTIMSFESKYS